MPRPVLLLDLAGRVLGLPGRLDLPGRLVGFLQDAARGRVEVGHDPALDAAARPLGGALPALQALAGHLDGGHRPLDAARALHGQPAVADVLAELVARPAGFLGAVEPAVLLVDRQRGDLGVVLEAQLVAPPRQLEAPGDPGVVADRLVIEPGGLDRPPVTIRIPRLPVDHPVTEEPGRRIHNTGNLLSRPLPVLEWERMRKLQPHLGRQHLTGAFHSLFPATVQGPGIAIGQPRTMIAIAHVLYH